MFGYKMMLNGPMRYTRTRRLHHLGLLLTFLLTSLVIMAACSRSDLPTWLGGLPAPATPTPVAVTTALTLWRWPGTPAEDAHLQALVTGFEERNPTIAVTLMHPDNYTRRLRTAFGTDAPPDVFFLNLDQLPDFVHDGVVAPLPLAFSTDDDWYPQLQRAMHITDTPYCAPDSVYTLALFYNRARFDEAELPYPDATWQWSDLQAAAATLTNVETNRYGLVLAADVSRWAAFLVQAGGLLPSPGARTAAIDTPAATQALEVYTNLVLEGMAATPTTLNSRWPGEAFAQGSAAMMIEGNWAVAYLQEQAPELVYGLTTLSAGPAGHGTVSFATCYAIAAQGTNPAAAATLVAYLTSAAVQESWFAINDALPARPSLALQWRTAHPPLAPFLDDMNHAVAWQLPLKFQPWVTEMNDGLRQIFGGFIPASALLPAAQTVADEITNEE